MSSVWPFEFYKTPVSKGILLAVISVSCSLHLPFFAQYRLISVLEQRSLIRIFLSKFAFLNSKDLMFGGFLIFYFRIFERRYGSRKFASYILTNFALTTFLEMVAHYIANIYNLFDISSTPLGSCPVIFPLFVNYFFDIPRLTQFYVLGIPISIKTVIYALGLHFISSSPDSLTSAICGIISGLICYFNVFKICNIIKFPDMLSNLIGRHLAWLLDSQEPPEPHEKGATLEIQRQQQIETSEQEINHRMFRERTDNRHNEPIAGTSGLSPRNISQDQNVRRLVEMGFSRERVEQALARCNNDFESAMTILLRDN